MSSFTVTVKYTKEELQKVMREKHGVQNIVVERPSQATSIIEFLLNSLGIDSLHAGDSGADVVSGDDLLVNIDNGDYSDGWSKRVQEELKRLDDHIKK
jgi:hypothetical protein